MHHVLRVLSFCLGVLMLLILPCCEVDVKRSDDIYNYKNFPGGKWVVEKMEIPGTSYLAEYNGCDFQFFTPGTVTASLSGAVSANGTWMTYKDKYAFDLNFPGANNPLKRLNGTWSVSYSSASILRSTRMEGAETYTFWLKKS